MDYGNYRKDRVIFMKIKQKKPGRVLAAALCAVLLSGTVPAGRVHAADPEKVMQLRTKGIEDPLNTGKDWTGDYVAYSDCYLYKEQWDLEGFQELLTPPVLYRVTDAYRYDRGTRKRVMDLQSTLDGSANMVDLKEVAFVSAAVGGKESDFKNMNRIRPVAEQEVNMWKLTIKNPYDEEKNPTGMREPEISNIRREGGYLCFDYREVYSTGNCYLSAILLTERGEEIIGYDRLVDASYRGVGTVALEWPKEYDENGYVLKVFAEKYNGDNMTDYISDIQYVYKGADIDR